MNRTPQNTDAEGMAESGERRRFGRADEPADGTSWNQMELFTTILRCFYVNTRKETPRSCEDGG